LDFNSEFNFLASFFLESLFSASNAVFY
jgi:hypothetical protein